LRFVALLALVPLVGCSDVTGPDIGSAPAPISAASPIALTTRLSSAILAPGDSVTITVTLTNLADTAVTMASGDCTSPFVVSTLSGRAVGPDVAAEVCPAVLIERTLAPSQSVSVPYTWDGTLNGVERTRIRAGEYLVRGSTQFGPVRSNAPAELTILP
jgi:hypothetical protein